MKRVSLVAASIAGALVISGCGNTVGKRAATGGVAGAILAGPAGALVGGTLGAVAK